LYAPSKDPFLSDPPCASKRNTARRNTGPQKGAKMIRKLLAMGTMLVLLLAAAAPAFADTAVAGDVDLQFVDASQTQAAAALQTNTGDVTSTASSTAGDFASAADASAEASIDQSLTIEQSQWNGGVWWTWWWM
jgi:hypothetical protein